MEKNIKDKIRKEVELLSTKKVQSDEFNIFTKGYLDSLNVLHIIIFIESEFSINVNPYDISIEDLNSVNKITNFVLNKIR